MVPPGQFVWYHRVRMPRQSLAQAFGLWRSGKFTNGTPGAAPRVASVRQDPNWPVLAVHHLSAL